MSWQVKEKGVLAKQSRPTTSKTELLLLLFMCSGILTVGGISILQIPFDLHPWSFERTLILVFPLHSSEWTRLCAEIPTLRVSMGHKTDNFLINVNTINKSKSMVEWILVSSVHLNAFPSILAVKRRTHDRFQSLTSAKTSLQLRLLYPSTCAPQSMRGENLKEKGKVPPAFTHWLPSCSSSS